MRYFNTVSEARSYLENTPGLLARAQGAALKVARGYRVLCTDPVILAARSNLLLHLRPAPVVARVALATAILRPDVREWLGREVAVAGFLAARGAGVVPPSEEIPPGPHEAHGQIMTFWRFAQPNPERQPSVAEAAEALQELHRALRDFPNELPVWSRRSSRSPVCSTGSGTGAISPRPISPSSGRLTSGWPRSCALPPGRSRRCTATPTSGT